MFCSLSCNLTSAYPLKSVFPLAPTGKLRSEWTVMPLILNEALPVVAVTVQFCCMRFLYSIYSINQNLYFWDLMSMWDKLLVLHYLVDLLIFH